MEQRELLRRAEDLARRSERENIMTCSNFLTPAEQMQLAQHFQNRADIRLQLSGGHPDCERKLALFLPDWMEDEMLDLSDEIKAIALKAHFGSPGHRDYLGALLGMGIGREWLGDIWIRGEEAVVFCRPGILQHLLGIEKVGRIAVTARETPLDAVPPPEQQRQKLTFSVMSPRLDAVTAGIFHLSRSEAARRIALGLVSLNYSEAEKPDQIVREGDVISLRGAGKGRLLESGGTSRKGRTFLTAERWL